MSSSFVKNPMRSLIPANGNGIRIDDGLRASDLKECADSTPTEMPESLPSAPPNHVADGYDG